MESTYVLIIVILVLLAYHFQSPQAPVRPYSERELIHSPDVGRNIEYWLKNMSVQCGSALEVGEFYQHVVFRNTHQQFAHFVNPRLLELTGANSTRREVLTHCPKGSHTTSGVVRQLAGYPVRTHVFSDEVTMRARDINGTSRVHNLTQHVAWCVQKYLYYFDHWSCPPPDEL
jgi:hypothetical protein